MNIFQKLKEDKYFLITIFILALIIRLLVFGETGNNNSDGMYKTFLTMNWLKHPYFVTEGLWPPLHLYLMAFMMLIWKNIYISPGLVSMVFGVLTIFPYYYLIKLIFDKRTAMLSTLLLTFLSLHIQLSTTSLAEVPVLFFLFTSIYFLFRFKKSEHKKLFYLITSAIFLNLACMIRYEAWLFIPILTIFTLNNINDIKKLPVLKNDVTKYLLIFLIISLIFPTLWIFGNYQSLQKDFSLSQTWTGNFLKDNIILNPEAPEVNPPLIKQLVSWPRLLFSNLKIISVLAGLGLIVSLFRKKHLEFLIIFVLLMLIYTYKLVTFTMTLQSRYILLPVLFLIPYFSTGLEYMLKSLNKDRSRIITILILFFIITTSSYNAIVKNPYTTPGDVIDVSNWLKTNVNTTDKILMDEYNWRSLHILFYTGFNTTFTENYFENFEFVTDQVRIVPGGHVKIYETNVINYLEKDKPLYLVYSHKGILSPILNFSSRCQNEVKFNYTFECKYVTGNYNIYKIKTNMTPE